MPEWFWWAALKIPICWSPNRRLVGTQRWTHLGQRWQIGYLHFNDALWQVGRDFGQALSSTVHDVITASAAGRAWEGVGIAGRSLWMRTCGARTQHLLLTSVSGASRHQLASPGCRLACKLAGKWSPTDISPPLGITGEILTLTSLFSICSNCSVSSPSPACIEKGFLSVSHSRNYATGIRGPLRQTAFSGCSTSERCPEVLTFTQWLMSVYSTFFLKKLVGSRWRYQNRGNKMVDFPHLGHCQNVQNDVKMFLHSPAVIPKPFPISFYIYNTCK